MVAAAIGAAALAGAMPAVARSQTVRTPHMPAAGPVLAGQDLVWADQAADRGFAVVAAPLGGGGPRTLRAFAPLDGDQIVVPAIAASPDRVAVEAYDARQALARGDGTHRLQAFQGPLSGPLEALGPPCDGVPGGSVTPLRSVDVEGQAVAALGPSCGGERPQGATVTDFASDPPASRSLPDARASVRLAGGLVGFAAEPDAEGRLFTVRDRSTGAEVYSVRVRDLGGRMVRELGTSFDLQSDGKLAFTYRFHGSGGRTVAWSAPGDPRPHVLDLPRSGHVAVKWARRDQLLVMRARRGSAGTVSGGVLELRALDGRLVRTLARGVVDRSEREAFDADGERVAFTTRDCGGVRFHVRPLTGGSTFVHRERRCALRLAGGIRLAGPSELRATLRCRGLLTVCQGWRAVATARVGGRTRVIARDPSTPPRAPVLHMTVNPLGRRLLARRPHARIRLAVSVGDPSFVSYGEPTARQRRSGRFVVR